MAKSIRSKSKRKARAEFRRTIGEAAHQANMKIIQQKLAETKQKGSLKSLERISSLMEVSPDVDTDVNSNEAMMAEEELGVDALETTTGVLPSMESSLMLKGENKAPIKKSNRRRKHALASRTKKSSEKGPEGTKQRPRYYCKF